jgi:hypothetical protein
VGTGRDGFRRSVLAAGRTALLWNRFGFSPETVAAGRFAVHSDAMTDSGHGGPYFWCTRHNRVETETDVCPARHVLGPYASAAEATNALEKVRQRNEAWEAEDARWAGEEG